MSKNKFTNSLFIVIVILLLSSCTSSRKSLKTADNTVAESNQPRYILQAERYFQKGKQYLTNGELEPARFYFDRVINILLDSASGNADAEMRIKNYIDRIAEIELAYMNDQVTDQPEQQTDILAEVLSSPLFEPSPQEVSTLKKEVDDTKPKYSIPVTINPTVVSFIKAFQTVRKKNIQNALNRSVQYIDDFKRIFREKGLPEDLAYLPIIESGYRMNALSRARARGIWQFMAGTGKMFGLRVDWVVDERRDPYKAAAAAADYLKHLYKEYGDWYLALACYNGGPRRVNRAIRRLKTKDFFKIAYSRHRYLRRETRNYVPAFLASLIIAKSPEKYGFNIEPEEPVFKDTKTVPTPSPVSLKEMSALTGVPYAKLKNINPELERDFTPFNKKTYDIRLPVETDESVLQNLKRLPPEKKLFVGWYRVKRGDSLYQIARKFRTSVKKIKHTNKLRSNLIRPGKRLLIPRGF